MIENWLKGSMLGLSMAVASLFGGAAQAATVHLVQDHTAAPVTVVPGQVFSFLYPTLNSSVVAGFVSFVLKITYADASDAPLPGALAENWTARIFGNTNPGKYIDVQLTNVNSPTSTTILVGTAPTQLFASLKNDLALNVRFKKAGPVGSFGTMTLNKLVLNIAYTNVPGVPLPAGGVLLLTGLGGLAALRRRRKA